MTARMDLLRARVLRLLEETDAGASENWRDSDPGYWVGVAEGAYSAERERNKALDVLREVGFFADARGERFCRLCGEHESEHGLRPDCRLAQLMTSTVGER